MAIITSYMSFLIRLSSFQDSAAPTTLQWKGEVQHIQSDQRWTFSTIDELLAFLRHYTEAIAEAESSPESRRYGGAP
jgi:hypothetical protein